MRRSQEEEIACLREDMEVLLALRAQCHTCIRKNIYLLHHNTGIKSNTDPHMYSLTNTQTTHPHPPPQLPQQGSASSSTTIAHTATPSHQPTLSSSPMPSTPTATSLWPTFNIFSYFFSSSPASASATPALPSSSLSTDIIQRV